jgi:diguanylate cyclase (GGDEF)-like protein/PAS domain S-box-containing protein
MDLGSVSRDCERLLHAILRFGKVPILVADATTPDTPIILVNPAFEHATGYRAAEVVGRSYYLLYANDRPQSCRAALAHALSTGTPCEVQFRLRRRDGQLAWTRNSICPVTDDHGNVTHFVSIQHDGAAQAELAEALREQQAFIDTSPDAYLKIAADLTVLQANRACEAISGWSAAELVGANAARFLPPTRLAEAQHVVRTLLSQAQPDRFTAEYPSKDGGPITIEWSAMRAGSQDQLLLVGRDVTAKQAAEREAARANAQVASILGSITEGCFSLERDWSCNYINDCAAAWLGRSRADIIGRNLWEAFPEAVGCTFYATFHHAMATQQFCQCEAYYAPSGRWLEARAYPSEQGLTVFVLDISGRKKQELALIHAATHDMLTGLPNRSACLEKLGERLDRAAVADEDVAVIFIDLDYFKEINDAFGHVAGDEALAQVGSRLLCFASNTCYPARISGDEFVVIVSGSGVAQASQLALQMLDSIAAPIALNGREATLGASIGIALAQGATMTADDLINQADTAMYVAKSKGRHALAVFNADVDSWNLMLQALHRGQFLLHYQPQVNLVAGRIVGAEALVRWQHPEFGLLGPAAFLDLAEESPLIIEIGAWVFDEACRQLRQWQDRGYALSMSINVSARQLASRGTPEMMVQAVQRHDVSPHCIKLEVTESMLAQDFDAMSQILAGLKQQGFHIALDDFGTGYSNLSYISRLPVTAIKIDRSFVTGLANDRAALSLMKGIVALAKSLDLTVICEGVETAEQRALLATTQCDSIQGYLIGKPLPAEVFCADFLVNWWAQVAT